MILRGGCALHPNIVYRLGWRVSLAPVVGSPYSLKDNLRVETWVEVR